MEIITHKEKSPHRRSTLVATGAVLMIIILGAAGIPMINYQTVCNDEACFEAPELIALDTPTAQEIEVPSFLPSANGVQSLYWSVYNIEGQNLGKATMALDLYHNYQFYVKDVSDDSILLGSKVVADDFTYRDGHIYFTDGSTIPVEPEYLFQLVGKELDTRINVQRTKESTSIALTTYRIHPNRSEAEHLFFMAHSDISGRVFNDFSLTLLKGKISEELASLKVQPTNHMICALDAQRQNYSRLLDTTMNEMNLLSTKLKKRSRRSQLAKRSLSGDMYNTLGVIAYNLQQLTGDDKYVTTGVHIDTQLSLSSAAKKIEKGLSKGKSNFKKAYRMIARAKKLASKAQRIYTEGNVEYIRTGAGFCTLPDMSEHQVLVQPVHPPLESAPAESEPNIDVAKNSGSLSAAL